MIRSHFLASIRGFIKNRYYTTVNIIGLGIGLACFIVITQYIEFEKSFDSFYPEASRIYRVASQKIQNGEVQHARAQAPVILKDAIVDNVPEIESAIRIHPLDAKMVTLRRYLPGGERIDITENNVYHSESGFFDLFDFNLVEGSKGKLLDEPYTVVLSESMAYKLFGNENPLGKSIRIIEDFDDLYKVTGVMEDLPENTHFKFNLLISYETFRAQHPNWRWTAWDWDYFFTYIKARPGVRQSELQFKIQAVADRIGKPQYDDRNYTMQFDLQPVKEIHLNSHLEGEFEVNGEASYLNFLYGIALAILILAWVNFINLAVARAMMRAPEIGVRKTFGAGKYHLAVQFLLETGILQLLALAFGLALIALSDLLLPEMLNIHLPQGHLHNGYFWLSLGGIWLAGVLLTSLYPVSLIAGYKPNKVLKGKVETSSKGAKVWRGLVTMQYAVSILLIVITLVVRDQVDFLKNRDLGISLSQVLTVYAPAARDDSYWSQVDLIKNELSSTPGVSFVTGHSYLPGENLRHVELFQLEGKDINEATLMKYQPIDYDYFALFNIKLLAGRDFEYGQSTRVETDSYVGEIILNEAAIKALGLANAEEAIGRPIVLQHSFGRLSHTRIRGVVANFTQLALNGDNLPMAFVLTRDSFAWHESEYLSFKVETDNVQETVSKIETAFHHSFPEYAFQYFFTDDSYNQAYQTHLKFGKLIAVFSSVALVLALFGLIGISTYTISKKLKEIAIRKVHGAAVHQIAFRLLGSIILLITVGFVIAIPLSYILSLEWLRNFEERVDIQVWMFALPLISILSISILTVLYHTLRAARLNPITIIKDD